MGRVVLYISGHHIHFRALGYTYLCLHHFNIDNDYCYAPRHYTGNSHSWPISAMSLWPLPAKSGLHETLKCVSSTVVANFKRRPVWPTPAKQHSKVLIAFSLLLGILT